MWTVFMEPLLYFSKHKQPFSLLITQVLGSGSIVYEFLHIHYHAPSRDQSRDLRVNVYFNFTIALSHSSTTAGFRSIWFYPENIELCSIFTQIGYQENIWHLTFSLKNWKRKKIFFHSFTIYARYREWRRLDKKVSIK